MGNKYDLDKYSQTVKGGKTKLSPEDEKYFQEWYQVWSNVSGISNNPDDPLHYYDYRGAWKEGDKPTISPEDNEYHWPSKHKDDMHPNRYIQLEDKNWYDTKNDKKVPAEDMIMQKMLRSVLEGTEIFI